MKLTNYESVLSPKTLQLPEHHILTKKHSIIHDKDSLANYFVGTLNIELCLSGSAVSVLATVNDRIVPLTIGSLNKKVVTKEIGTSWNTIFGAFCDIVNQGRSKKDWINPIKNTVGYYRIKYVDEYTAQLLVNNVPVIKYEINGIDESMYRGSEFTFLRNLTWKAYDMSDPNAERPDAIRDAAILIPTIAKCTSNKRIAKKQGRDINHITVIEALHKYDTTDLFKGLNIKVSDAYASEYKYLKGV